MLNVPLTIPEIHFKVGSMAGIINGALIAHRGTLGDWKPDFRDYRQKMIVQLMTAIDQQ